jgi:hypothetical protein
MQTFYEWLSQLNLLRRLNETYYSFNAAEYNNLFRQELQHVIAKTTDPAHRQIMEKMIGFDWLAYIASAVRHAGYWDQRENAERTHDVVVKLLTGKLFRGFDERTSGPMDLRFKRSVSNAIRNIVEKEKNRKRFLPSISIGQEFTLGGVRADDIAARSVPQQDDEVIRNFRELVRRRLGEMAVAVFDARMGGSEMKSLVGSPVVGGAGKFVVKRVVRQVKELAREYADSLGDPGFLRQVERAMGRESETIRKRQAAIVGA